MLGGVGYGAVAALAYARAHPDRVARLVLDTPVDPEALDGLDLERLRSVHAGAARDLRARAPAGPPAAIPLGDLTKLDRRLRTRPVTGTVALPNGRRARAGFGGPRDPRALLDLLAAGDRLPALRAGVPAAVRSAVANDPAPLLRLAARAVEPDQPARRTRAATRLATGLPRRVAALDRRDARRRPRHRPDRRGGGACRTPTLAPFGRGAVLGGSLAQLCTAWPEGPQALPAGPLPDVPVLVLSGREDVQAPAEAVARVAARFPRATSRRRPARRPRAARRSHLRAPGAAALRARRRGRHALRRRRPARAAAAVRPGDAGEDAPRAGLRRQPRPHADGRRRRAAGRGLRRAARPGHAPSPAAGALEPCAAAAPPPASAAAT